MNPRTTLTDTDLAEMSLKLIRYSEHPGHLDAFREKCAETAALIEALLAGRDVKDATIAAIEAVFGPLAKSEIARMKRVEELDHELLDAFEAQDQARWKATFKQLLDELSEAQIEVVMDGMFDLSQCSTATMVDAASLHDMPAGVM